MKRVVILIFQTFLPTQGRFPRVSGQAHILREAGYEVVVVCCKRGGEAALEETLDGIRVKRIPVETWEMRGPFWQAFPLLLFMARAFHMIRSMSVDALHCHNLDVLPLGVLLKRVKGCRLVFDAHEPNYYGLWPKKWSWALPLVKAVEAFCARRADFISVTNAYQVEKYRAMGLTAVDVIGNYPAPALRARALDETKRKKKAVAFGRLGTLYPNVGIEETVKAFRQVRVNHTMVSLFIAGRVVDTYKDAFDRCLAPVREAVEYGGAYRADDMPCLYRRIDVSLLVYPKNDWFRHITPTKFFDSLANGVPVIMTDIGGLGDVIRQGQCGLVVDERDIPGIVHAMECLIRNRDLLWKLSENALRLAEREYSWERMAARYVAVHHELLQVG